MLLCMRVAPESSGTQDIFLFIVTIGNCVKLYFDLDHDVNIPKSKHSIDTLYIQAVGQAQLCIKPDGCFCSLRSDPKKNSTYFLHLLSYESIKLELTEDLLTLTIDMTEISL